MNRANVAQILAVLIDLPMTTDIDDEFEELYQIRILEGRAIWKVEQLEVSSAVCVQSEGFWLVLVLLHVHRNRRGCWKKRYWKIAEKLTSCVS